jgi:hypothetical protein
MPNPPDDFADEIMNVVANNFRHDARRKIALMIRERDFAIVTSPNEAVGGTCVR